MQWTNSALLLFVAIGLGAMFASHKKSILQNYIPTQGSNFFCRKLQAFLCENQLSYGHIATIFVEFIFDQFVCSSTVARVGEKLAGSGGSKVNVPQRTNFWKGTLAIHLLSALLTDFNPDRPFYGLPTLNVKSTQTANFKCAQIQGIFRLSLIIIYYSRPF